MSPRGKKRAAYSDMRCRTLRSSRRRGWVMERREVVYRGGLDSIRVSVSAALSRDREAHAARVRNVLPSRGDEISPATVTSSEAEERTWHEAR